MRTDTYDETKWVLVPKEPTRKMFIDGFTAWVNGIPQKDEYRAIACYKAMLAAAPKPDLDYVSRDTKE